jgi:hypothetical protein
MFNLIQIPTSSEAPRSPLTSCVSGLAGAWIASGRRGGPLTAPGSVFVMPFLVQDYDYDDANALEEALDIAEQTGFSFLAVLPGLSSTYEPGAGMSSSVTPRILLHQSPHKDQVAEILALIQKLDDDQLTDLIDRLPESVLDPICERCDPFEDMDVSTHEAQEHHRMAESVMNGFSEGFTPDQPSTAEEEQF